MCQENNSCQQCTHTPTSNDSALQKLNVEKVIEQLITRSTTKEEASFGLTHLGAIYLESKNLEAAEQFFTKALEQQENGFVHSNLGTLYMQQNKLEEAKKHWHLAADTYNMLAARFNLARLYKQEKNNELAKQYYMPVADIKTEYTAVACFELAEIFATENNFEKEAHYLHKAADEFDFPYAHSTLGLVYMEKDPVKAREYLLRALARRHEWAWKNNEHILDEVHYNLGVLFEKQNNPKLAKKYYKRAADHEHPGSCWRMALLIGDENSTLAKKYLHVVADKYNASFAQWQLGWIYAGENNFEQAKVYWHKAADEHKNLHAAINLSHLYHLVDDTENAQKYYAFAVENAQEPEDKEAVEKLRVRLAQKEEQTATPESL